jgi:predicted nucleic acid-binding protein
MIVLDTDVLLLAFAFQQDERQPVNRAFLQLVQADATAITVYTLMELLGQLSFNLAPERLSAWQSWLVDAYQLTVIWPVDPDAPISAFSFRREIVDLPFERMRAHRAAFMDALILGLAERAPGSEIFVTWNARHFRGKSALKVLTPQEYLEQAR